MGTSDVMDRREVSEKRVVLSGQSHRQLRAACNHAEKLLGCNDEDIATEHLKKLLRSLLTLRRDIS